MKKNIFVVLLNVAHISAFTQTVNVLDFGCTDSDATACIQKAFDSGAKKVVIPYTGKPYIVSPLFARSNQEILIDRDVVIQAKQGEFKGLRDALITVEGVNNVSIIGYGAILRMRKEDYQNTSLYSHSEWRHALNINVSNNTATDNIIIKGLWIEKSGGDGILVGGESGYPNFQPYQASNVLIDDVVCHDNHRQGISVTGADKLKIINTVLKDTKGTPPQAGIDFEPDWARLSEVEMTNCFVYNNRVSGIELFLYRPAWKGLKDISLKFKHCYVDSDPGIQGLGLNIRYNDDIEGANGNILFEKCNFKNNTTYSTAHISDMSALKAKINFSDCQFEQLNPRGKIIEFLTEKLEIKDKLNFGGIRFNNSNIINDRFDRNAITFTDNSVTGKGITDVFGNIKINNPLGAKINLGSIQSNVSLTVSESKSNYANIAIEKPLMLEIVEQGNTLSAIAKANNPTVGTNNGDGIEGVKFTIRRGDNVITESTDNTAPYQIENITSEWQEGIYLLVVEAITSGSKISTIKAIPFRILKTRQITDNLKRVNHDSKVNLYYDSSNKNLYINDAVPQSTLLIGDVCGKILYQDSINSSNYEISLPLLTTGVYLVKVGEITKKINVE